MFLFEKIGIIRETTPEAWAEVPREVMENLAPGKPLRDYQIAGLAEFAALGTEEKRAMLFEMLDANRLYVNRSDMDDEESGLSDADKAFTRSFYGEA